MCEPLCDSKQLLKLKDEWPPWAPWTRVRARPSVWRRPHGALPLHSASSLAPGSCRLLVLLISELGGPQTLSP